MGILDTTAKTPAVDTIGLPDYRVTTITIEANGADIRILAGDMRFGQVQWSHICTIPAIALLEVFPQFEKAAILAMTLAGSPDWALCHH